MNNDLLYLILDELKDIKGEQKKTNDRLTNIESKVDVLRIKLQVALNN